MSEAECHTDDYAKMQAAPWALWGAVNDSVPGIGTYMRKKQMMRSNVSPSSYLYLQNKDAQIGPKRDSKILRVALKQNVPSPHQK